MKIEVLFPEFCNLFGDAYNMVYLEKTLPEAEFYPHEIQRRCALYRRKNEPCVYGSHDGAYAGAGHPQVDAAEGENPKSH